MKHGSVQENHKGLPVRQKAFTISESNLSKLKRLQTSERDPPSTTHSSSPPLRNLEHPMRVKPIMICFHVEDLFDLEEGRNG